MTALYFGVLEAPDRVSVKPHASPVLHAINHLLGRLDRRYLTTLREYGGLQSYPSRTKDPDPVDYSTGSRRPRRHRADLGRARAPLRRRALRRPARRAPDRADRRRRARRGRLLGGDRRPDGRPPRRGHVGRRPQPPVARPRRPRHRRRPPRRDVRGRRLAHRDGQVRPAAAQAPRPARPHRRDAQRGVPAAAARRRARAARRASRSPSTTSTTPSCWPRSATSAATTSPACSTATARPTRSATARRVVFAYTIKGWSLPTEGHPANHSALLNHEQYRGAGGQAGRGRRGPVRAARRPARRRRSCARRPAAGSSAARRAPSRAPKVPHDLGRKHTGTASTQQAFGRFFVDLVREAPEVAERVVTVSPGRRHEHQPRRLDQQGRHLEPRRPDRLVRRRHRHARALARVRPRPPHRARDRRGQPRRRCSGELGATWSRDGQPLLPVGTIYDPFVSRALEPWSFGIYAGGQSILVGTPSRRHARPRGRRAPVGDHAVDRHRAARLRRLRARVRAGLRVVLPARALPARQARRHAAPTSGSPRARSTSRCTPARARRRSPAATGCGRTTHPQVVIAVMGALVPEALAAADTLTRRGGPRPSRSSASPAPTCCSAPSRPAPASATATRTRSSGCSARASRSSVLVDGHPHTLAFLGSPITCLGVQRFGQAGDIAELYEHHQIDAESVVGAALDLLG